MTSPLHLPTTRYVAAGWLNLAVPGVGVGVELPQAVDDDVRAKGFMRTANAGGSPGIYVQMRRPVVQVECWFPPPLKGQPASEARAEQLANRVLVATYDGALMGQLLDLSRFGSYAPARVHTVVAISEPDEVDEESDWARFDLDLLFRWTPETGA